METAFPRPVVRYAHWTVTGLFVAGAVVLLPFNMLMAGFASDSRTAIAIFMSMVIMIWGSIVIVTPAYLAFRSARNLNSESKLRSVVWPIASLSALSLHPLTLMFLWDAVSRLLAQDSQVRLDG